MQVCVELCGVQRDASLTDPTVLTVSEVPSLSRQPSAANLKELEEGRIPQTETFAEIVKAMLDTK